MDYLPRYTIDISKIDHINAQIEAYQRIINWYEDWKERNDPYEYVDERIEDLNGQLAEYLIAREFAMENLQNPDAENHISILSSSQSMEET